MKLFIKPANVQEIDNHVKNHFESKIVGSKLFALIKLIDKKGVKVEAPENESINGVKVIEYKKGYYIGYIKTEYKNGSFKLQIFSLKNA